MNEPPLDKFRRCCFSQWHGHSRPAAFPLCFTKSYFSVPVHMQDYLGSFPVCRIVVRQLHT